MKVEEVVVCIVVKGVKDEVLGKLLMPFVFLPIKEVFFLSVFASYGEFGNNAETFLNL